jgi:hypothetical protein
MWTLDTVIRFLCAQQLSSKPGIHFPLGCSERRNRERNPPFPVSSALASARATGCSERANYEGRAVQESFLGRLLGYGIGLDFSLPQQVTNLQRNGGYSVVTDLQKL